MPTPIITPKTWIRGRLRAAQYLGISTRLLVELEKAGRITPLRHNQRLQFYRVSDLDNFVISEAAKYEQRKVEAEAGL